MKLATLTNPNFFSALNKLLTCDMPMKTAFKLKKEALKLDAEKKQYEEMKQKVIADLGDKNEDGSPKTDKDGRILFSEGKEAEAVSKINELLTIDIEIGQYSVDDFGDASISAVDLLTLDEMIKE